MPSLKQLQNRRAVDEIERETEDGGYIVYLAPGYGLSGQGNEISGAHTFGADTLAEIAATLREQVAPCYCGDCQSTRKVAAYYAENPSEFRSNRAPASDDLAIEATEDDMVQDCDGTIADADRAPDDLVAAAQDATPAQVAAAITATVAPAGRIETLASELRAEAKAERDSVKGKPKTFRTVPLVAAQLLERVAGQVEAATPAAPVIDARGFKPPTAKQFAKLVEATGLTRVDLAARLGVSDRQVRNWTNPKARSATRVPYLVDCAVRVLIEAKGAGE